MREFEINGERLYIHICICTYLNEQKFNTGFLNPNQKRAVCLLNCVLYVGFRPHIHLHVHACAHTRTCTYIHTSIFMRICTSSSMLTFMARVYVRARMQKHPGPLRFCRNRRGETFVALSECPFAFTYV